MEGTTPTAQAIRETGGQGQRQEKNRHSCRPRTVGFHLGHRGQGGSDCQAENSRLTKGKSKSKNIPKNEKAKTMNSVAKLEHRASSSRSKHEGESSFGLCDRLSRTRDNSQRQLPTDQDYAVSTREYQTDQSSLKTAPTAARSVLDGRPKQPQQQTHRLRRLTRSLHIRPRHLSRPRGLRVTAAHSLRPHVPPALFWVSAQRGKEGD